MDVRGKWQALASLMKVDTEVGVAAWKGLLSYRVPRSTKGFCPTPGRLLASIFLREGKVK